MLHLLANNNQHNQHIFVSLLSTFVPIMAAWCGWYGTTKISPASGAADFTFGATTALRRSGRCMFLQEKKRENHQIDIKLYNLRLRILNQYQININSIDSLWNFKNCSVFCWFSLVYLQCPNFWKPAFDVSDHKWQMGTLNSILRTPTCDKLAMLRHPISDNEHGRLAPFGGRWSSMDWILQEVDMHNLRILSSL